MSNTEVTLYFYANMIVREATTSAKSASQLPASPLVKLQIKQ